MNQEQERERDRGVPASAEEERAAVVEWLRMKRRDSHWTWRERWPFLKALLFWPDNLLDGMCIALADAVERGDHLK